MTNAQNKTVYKEERNPVEVIVLDNTDFRRELVSNGKLKALRKSVLTFRISEELEYLPVCNGESVRKGQIIARLRQFKVLQELEKAQIQFEQASIEMKDELLIKGYTANDLTKISEEVIRTTAIRAGLTTAENQLKTAQHNLEATVLKAPFPGKIANLSYKVFEQIPQGNDFCLLIDDSDFEVEFSVLETELQEVSIGKEVKIVPFALDTVVKGRVSEKNPVVAETGLVNVKALIRNPGFLIEGMNVKVFVESMVSHQLVVPKSAVVLRQNQEVLFKYTSGMAYWTYVKTTHENSNSYAVIAQPGKGGTLSAGDTVIISGNLNLAHESNVVIK
jgi:RND family efflux transporter MFP subunit